jgi:hypothetical protein
MSACECRLSQRGLARAHLMAPRAVPGATAGTAPEWFDFALYGVVTATIFSKLFFPSLEPTAALLAPLASFWAGRAARALGAVICGHARRSLGTSQSDAHYGVGDGLVTLPNGSAAHLPASWRSCADVAGLTAHHPGFRARR